ncbi:GNAT family N-acetyltransferase [Halorarius halobius]|uniref:GNAT family N-acetyltransferase n=1 Tax=Halorarius halobius TaxID=2962671 RepID=UPI0020CD937A|nr:GNAT family N-acetyltransferase [Halorarius halobius]
MQVRVATSEDAEALPDLHSAAVEAFGHGHYTDEQVDDWAKRGERSADDYPVGEAGEHFTVCVVRPEDTPRDTRTATDGSRERRGAVAGFGHLAIEERAVHAVYVHPDHARAGVGSALLAELEGFARGQGIEALSLQSSLNAVGFYERSGYERVEDGESPGGLPVIEMRKRL